MNNPRVCVVVATKDRWELTKRFLVSFKKNTFKNYVIVITDDKSKDGTPQNIKNEYPEVILKLGNGNFWWAGGTNSGVKYALENNFDYVLTINNDAVIDSPNYLQTLIDCSFNNPNSLIGSLILKSTDRRIYSVGGRLDWVGAFLINLNYFDRDISVLKKLENPYPVEIMNGNGTLIPTKVFKEIGLYNQFFTPHYHADSEIVLRAKKYGYSAFICLDAVVIDEYDEKFIPKGLNLFFSKKSNYYFPAFLYFYIKYNPTKKYFGLIRQYFHFFKDIPLLRKMAYLIRKYILRYSEDKL